MKLISPSIFTAIRDSIQQWSGWPQKLLSRIPAVRCTIPHAWRLLQLLVYLSTQCLYPTALRQQQPLVNKHNLLPSQLTGSWGSKPVQLETPAYKSLFLSVSPLSRSILIDWGCMLRNALIFHIWTATSSPLQVAQTDFICKYFMRSHYPTCHDAEGMSCMLWLHDPAAKPTLCTTDKFKHRLEMPAWIMHVI